MAWLLTPQSLPSGVSPRQSTEIAFTGLSVSPCGCVGWVLLGLWVISSLPAFGSRRYLLQELCNSIHKMFFPSWPPCLSGCSSPSPGSSPLNVGICWDSSTDPLLFYVPWVVSSDHIPLLSAIWIVISSTAQVGQWNAPRVPQPQCFQPWNHHFLNQTGSSSPLSICALDHGSTFVRIIEVRNLGDILDSLLLS